jgi:hypothetical protein
MTEPMALRETTNDEERIRRSKEVRLNDLKYDLMVVNQDLSKVVPSSKLAEEILGRSAKLQKEIQRLEEELSREPEHKREAAPLSEGIKKLKDEGGQVRIWSSKS